MQTSLAVGSFTPSVLLAVARRTGRLEEHGVEAREVPVASSPAQFRALIDGELDVAFTSPDNVVAYRFSPSNPLGATADVAIVGAVDRGMGLGLYTRPGITEPSQLQGARVAVDVATSGFALAMYAVAESLGLGREQYSIEALGSTPKRLAALLDGRCDATMLNAGNELVAEDAGCTLLGKVSAVCTPYLGTVLAVAGPRRRVAARALATALDAAISDVAGGDLDAVVAGLASEVLDLPERLAWRYVERLRDPAEGLLVPGAAELGPALRTIVDLRRRYLPEVVDGVDVLATALDPSAGLVAPEATTR